MKKTSYAMSPLKSADTRTTPWRISDKGSIISFPMTKEKRRLLLNTLLLTGTTLCIQSIGMGFNAWLSQRIGAEGVGLFQQLLSVYVMAIMLAVSGMRLPVCGCAPRRLPSSGAHDASSLHACA